MEGMLEMEADCNLDEVCLMKVSMQLYAGNSQTIVPR